MATERRRVRLYLLLMGIVSLLCGCANHSRRDYVELDRYEIEDLAPYRELLIEDEFAQHPELIEHTVYHLRHEVGNPPSEITARARIRFTNRAAEAIREIPFFLYPNLTPGRLDVHSLTVGGSRIGPVFHDRRRAGLQLPARGAFRRVGSIEGLGGI